MQCATIFQKNPSRCFGKNKISHKNTCIFFQQVGALARLARWKSFGKSHLWALGFCLNKEDFQRKNHFWHSQQVSMWKSIFLRGMNSVRRKHNRRVLRSADLQRKIVKRETCSEVEIWREHCSVAAWWSFAKAHGCWKLSPFQLFAVCANSLPSHNLHKFTSTGLLALASLLQLTCTWQLAFAT